MTSCRQSDAYVEVLSLFVDFAMPRPQTKFLSEQSHTSGNPPRVRNSHSIRIASEDNLFQPQNLEIHDPKREIHEVDVGYRNTPPRNSSAPSASTFQARDSRPWLCSPGSYPVAPVSKLRLVKALGPVIPIRGLTGVLTDLAGQGARHSRGGSRQSTPACRSAVGAVEDLVAAVNERKQAFRGHPPSGQGSGHDLPPCPRVTEARPPGRSPRLART